MTDPELEALAAMIDGRVFENNVYTRHPETVAGHCNGCVFHSSFAGCKEFRGSLRLADTLIANTCQSKIWQLLPTSKE